MVNYERDMRIDDSALDVEWFEQANLAMKYGKIWAEANRNLLIAEENLKIIKAELIKRVNQNPMEKVGKEKPTDLDKETYYRSHRQYKEAKQEWIEAQYELDMATIAKNEISFTRKAALENLVVLFGQNYFAGPSMPRDINVERSRFLSKRDQDTNTGISRKLRRRRND